MIERQETEEQVPGVPEVAEKEWVPGEIEELGVVGQESEKEILTAHTAIVLEMCSRRKEPGEVREKGRMMSLPDKNPKTIHQGGKASLSNKEDPDEEPEEWIENGKGFVMDEQETYLSSPHQIPMFVPNPLGLHSQTDSSKARVSFQCV